MGKRLLLIDDSSRVCHCIADIIKLVGHELVAVGDGAEGVSMATDEKFDLIISDLHMPGTPSGMELVRALRECAPKCPIIIVSGYPSENVVHECDELGVTDFLIKPFGLSFLLSIIERELGSTAD